MHNWDLGLFSSGVYFYRLLQKNSLHNSDLSWMHNWVLTFLGGLQKLEVSIAKDSSLYPASVANL